MMRLTNFAVPRILLPRFHVYCMSLTQGCKKKVMLTIGLSLVTPKVMNNEKNPRMVLFVKQLPFYGFLLL
jgi:hypothetical protein